MITVPNRLFVVSSLLVALLVVLVACGGASPDNNALSSAPMGSSASPGQVTITGAINKMYTPVSIEAGPIGNNVYVNVNEADVGGVALQFPADAQPGAYSVEDHLHVPIGDVIADYITYGDNRVTYLGTGGTLTLTTTGEKFSGQFAFTAGNTQDGSKTIQVMGTFADVSLQK
jgi:hypothetical protein